MFIGWAEQVVLGNPALQLPSLSVVIVKVLKNSSKFSKKLVKRFRVSSLQWQLNMKHLNNGKQRPKLHLEAVILEVAVEAVLIVVKRDICPENVQVGQDLVEVVEVEGEVAEVVASTVAKEGTCLETALNPDVDVKFT